ncbi:MAG TPA: Gfo/Idh/MocA family oxidoreductase [Solirubrobacteraceae bacterium]|nr:Gfo/Idh/MocA family oxidoreductase [Solirubrobacteraceae bacterium]
MAILGYGYWGPNLARNVAAASRARLSVVCDLDAGARARASRLHGGARVTDDWDSVLADDSVDAVMVALPVTLHHCYALEALQAGKHVLVEKPLARSVAECDELICTAAERGRVLMVGHTFEFNAAVRLVGEYVRTGELGDPYYISMRRTNLGIVRSDENAMWSLAPHDISILIHWLQRAPVSVNATGAALLQPGIEDVVFLSVRFEDDVIGHVHCSWLDPNKVRDATVVGSRKMAVYDDMSSDMKVRLYDKGVIKQRSLGRYETFARFQMLARAGDILVPKVEFGEPLALEIEHFVECIVEERAPLTDGANGRRVVAVLEAAQRSLENNGAAEAVALGPAARSGVQ